MKRPPLGPGGAATVFTLGLLGALKALALIGMAEALARGIVGVIAHDTAAWQRALLVGVGAGLLRAATTWATQVVAVRVYDYLINRGDIGAAAAQALVLAAILAVLVGTYLKLFGRQEEVA